MEITLDIESTICKFKLKKAGDFHFSRVGSKWLNHGNGNDYQFRIHSTFSNSSPFILLMEEILHHLGFIKPCKYWDKLPISWCRISAINSICVWLLFGSWATMEKGTCRDWQIPWPLLLNLLATALATDVAYHRIIRWRPYRQGPSLSSLHANVAGTRRPQSTASVREV